VLTHIPTGLYSLFVGLKQKQAETAQLSTRQRIINAAFVEFYRNGFQGGSLNHIIEAVGTTKGALFHHFASKQELGYAVVDEFIGPLLTKRWLKTALQSEDSIADLQRAFRTFVKEDIDSGAWIQGCPLNNLAQEMSPLDEGFRTRIDDLYTRWREAFAAALEKGKRAGKVRQDVSAQSIATLLVAAQMGLWGTAKSSQSRSLMNQTTEALCGYLEGLKA
jgi:TetR/AcrR family transcriptional repressor of nem operon